MAREMFVVCILSVSNSAWIDAAEIHDGDGDGAFRAFRVCEGLRALGLDAKVVHRWVGANSLACGESGSITPSRERLRSQDGFRGSAG